MIRPTLAQAVREASLYIERKNQARQAPRVEWQRLDEPVAALDVRMRALRNKLPVNVVILAVCEPHPQPLDGVTLCEMTRPMLELLHPKQDARYRVAHSGRGAGKSWCFARGLIARSLSDRLRNLLARELQTSIQESVHKLISDQINDLGLWPWFDIQQASITACTGSEFIFSGIRNNPTKLKSTEGIDVVWAEEAEKISKDSWGILIPTIRKSKSEIWVSFNPDQSDDPTFERFVSHQPPRTQIRKTSWRDNPWLSNELRDEKDYLASVDLDAYQHVWEGECRTVSDAQILRGKIFVEQFEVHPSCAGPYFGLDFGMIDPTAAIKCHIADKTLLITHEVYKVGCDIDHIPRLLDEIPGARNYVIRADCSRPETISYLQRNGYPLVEGVEKWAGSVEDGIAHLRSYEKIVIHPRCEHAITEARLYSYKTDRLTGDVLPDIIDKHNHIWDSVRYALQPLIRCGGTWAFGSL